MKTTGITDFLEVSIHFFAILEGLYRHDLGFVLIKMQKLANFILYFFFQHTYSNQAKDKMFAENTLSFQRELRCVVTDFDSFLAKLLPSPFRLLFLRFKKTLHANH